MNNDKRFWQGIAVKRSPATGCQSGEGVAFDDFNSFSLQTNLPVGIKICSGDVIDSVELLYSQEDFPKGESPFFHGGPKGRQHVFWLKEGEYIVRLDMEYGKYVFSADQAERENDVVVRLRVVTNTGRIGGWYGNECGKGSLLLVHPESLVFDPGDGLCCLYGLICKENMKLDNYVRSLGAYFIHF